MRKKALLAGATSAFEGPWVSLEEGEWLVEFGEDVEIRDGKVLAEGIRYNIVTEGLISGPTRVQAIVSESYNGPGIFLSAKQISNGANSCLQ